MNSTEGLHRVATAVRWVGWILGAPSVALGLWLASINWNRDGEVMLLIAACGVAVIAAGYVLAWIIDGFAEPKRAP